MRDANVLFYSIFLAFTLSACVHYEDIARERNASVEIIPPKVMVKISDVHVMKRDDGFEILGRVKRTGLGIMHGHVDVAVLLPEGAVLEMASTTYTPSFRRPYVRRREVQPSYFSVRFSDMLPIGSAVRIAFHPEELGKPFNCGNNQAVLGGIL